MNISPVNYNAIQINNKINDVKFNRNVAFCGNKQDMAQKIVKNAGCFGTAFLFLIIAPIYLISNSLFNKEDKINSMVYGMQNDYMNHMGSIDRFQDNVNYLNKFLDKYARNGSYAQFVKEVNEFLLANFEQYQGICDESMRLNPFGAERAFIKFMNTLRKSALAAISKNEKYIDKDKLDNDIQQAREIMQKVY